MTTETPRYPYSEASARTFQINGPGGSFDLYYAPSLMLTPDPANLHLGKVVGETMYKNKRGLRILEPGIGSGVFPATLIWQHKGLVSEVVGTDVSLPAIRTADWNLKRVAENSSQNVIFDLKLKNWIDDVHGKFDLIFFNPPFFTPEVKPPLRCKQNPRETMFPHSLGTHYEEVLSGISLHIKKDSTLIIRTPRHDFKNGQIWGIVSKHLNLGRFKAEDLSVPEGRFIVLTAQ